MTKLTKLTAPALALALIVTLSACDGGSSKASGNTADAAAAPTSIGNIAKGANLDFTVTAVATSITVGLAGVGPKAEPGETFVIISYTLKNTGNKPLAYAERPSLSLVGPTGQNYAADDMASGMAATTMSDPTGTIADLNPNVSAKSKAAWKVDKAAFDKATWKLVVAADPTLTFALK